MKISTVSKKVLASALSAAMVVAFAPTVAFGDTGDPVKISFDLQGGTASGSIEYPYAVWGTTITLPTVTKGGYVASWAVDIDGDLDYNDNVNPIDAGGTYQIDSAQVSFKATYDAVAFGTSGMVFDAVHSTITMEITGNGLSGTSVSDDAKTKEKVAYNLTVTNPNGVVLLSKTDTASKDGAAVLVTGNETNGYEQLSCTVPADFLVSGAYTAVITANGTEIAKKTMNIVKLTYKTSSNDKGTAKYYDAGDATQCGTIKGILVPNNSQDPLYNSEWLKDGYGFTVDENTLAALRGDVTITKLDDTKNLSVSATGYDEVDRTLTYSLPEVTNLAKDAVYAYEIKDPSGAVIYSGSFKGTSESGTAIDEFDLTVTFDQTVLGNRVAADATETAGDYVLSVTVTEKDADEAKLSGKAKITLTEVKYSAGENGKLKGDLKDANDVFTDLSGYNVDTNPSANNVEVSDGYTFEGWDLNGNGKFDAANNPIVAGKVNTFTATYKAIDYSTYVATPAIESATYDANKKSWTVKLACETAGVQLVYGTTETPATVYDASKGIENAAETVYVQAKRVAGQTDPALTNDSLVLEITRSTAGWTALTTGTAAIFLNEGKTTTKWAETETVKAAIEAGNASVEAAGYQTADDMEALLNAAAKALYEAVAAESAAQLGAYADGALVVSGSKVYSIASTDLETANEAIAKAAEDLGKEKNLTTDSYGNAIASLIAATNTALNKATESKDYTAADIEAAQAVTASLKAAATGEDAQAALDAYEALTDAQKALVATADVLAAHAVVDEAEKAAAEEAAKKAEEEAKAAAEKAAAEAAAALVAQQDKAAVNLVNNPKTKTVKLATAKKAKTTLTYKVKVSASGSLVTYAKVSGNAKITVGAAGKVTLKKVTKAGTYKAKVLVTCGEQTRTVTVKFVVSK